VPGRKNYTTKSPKLNSMGSKEKNLQKIKIQFFFKFFPNKNILLSTSKSLIHSIWTRKENVTDNVVFWAVLASS